MNINEKDVKYCYIRKTSNATNHIGIITLATHITPAGIFYGAAFCSPRDRFNKKTGRIISYGRLNNNVAFIELTMGEKRHKQIINYILNDILSTEAYPFNIKTLLLDAIELYSLSNIEDCPTITYPSGIKEWWLNNKKHREDGPAIIWPNGYNEWWLNGKLHREDGPAVEKANGYTMHGIKMENYIEKE